MRRRQEGPRWVDAYKVPGQFVAVRYPPDPISDSNAASMDAGNPDNHFLDAQAQEVHARISYTCLTISRLLSWNAVQKSHMSVCPCFKSYKLRMKGELQNLIEDIAGVQRLQPAFHIAGWQD